MTAPRTTEALQQAVRSLDDQALQIWADACEEAGDQEGADALRALPDLLAYVPGFLQSQDPRIVTKRGVYLSSDGSVAVSVGEAETPNSVRKTVVALLARWNDLNAAAEWLARHLDLKIVRLLYALPDGVVNEDAPADSVWRRYNEQTMSLKRGHLRPVEGTILSCTLRQPRK
jgi:hypothetical protein